jgi:hypothetical protein
MPVELLQILKILFNFELAGQRSHFLCCEGAGQCFCEVRPQTARFCFHRVIE